jgi:hypothetical protein
MVLVERQNGRTGLVVIEGCEERPAGVADGVCGSHRMEPTKLDARAPSCRRPTVPGQLS